MENAQEEHQTADVKLVDMTEEMMESAIKLAHKALQKFSIEKDIAQYIKFTFDKEFSTNWHCIVGRQFGSYISHDSKHYIYFYIGELSFLLWKFG
jgi:dynein light chain LC8-type